MKLDMNRAWTEALSLIQANIGVVATVAGVFFFLPYLAFALLMPETANFAVEPNPTIRPPRSIRLWRCMRTSGGSCCC